MVETRGGAQIGVLEENMQRVQQQVDDHTGSIERLHLKVDGLEAGVAEIRAMMQEVMKRLPVVEQPAVQPRQEEQSPNRVQANLGEQIPIAPREAHGVPLGAEVRNAMPMRPLNQDFRVKLISHELVCKRVSFLKMVRMDPFWVNLVTRLRKEGM
jgi:hypothetical protein